MIRFVIDSTCEPPEDVLHHPAVEVIPLSVVFGQQVLRDGAEITREQFWERLPVSDPLPTTSQANPGDFIGPFSRFTEAGDEVIALLLSSKLSGTCESAVIARDSLPGRPIDVVDSLSISVGSGLMLTKALAMAESGASRAEIVAALAGIRDCLRLMFVLDTLEYLQRGGRIGRAQAFVGTLLRFKPLLGLQGGEVVPLGRVRTKRKAIDAMLDLLSQQIPERGSQIRIGVAQAGVDEEAAEVSKMLQQRFDSPHAHIATLGPVIGTHTGPGVIGAAVYFDREANR